MGVHNTPPPQVHSWNEMGGHLLLLPSPAPALSPRASSFQLTQLTQAPRSHFKFHLKWPGTSVSWFEASGHFVTPHGASTPQLSTYILPLLHPARKRHPDIPILLGVLIGFRLGK